MTTTDWEAIEREYRAGVLSIREVGRLHGVSDTAIRKRAKEYGWERDLAEQVRQRAAVKLVRSLGSRDGSQEQRANDNETIDNAAGRQVELVRQHMASLSRANRIVDKLLVELETATDNRDELEEEVELETKEDRDPRRRQMMLRALSLAGRAQTARELSQTIKNLIPLERQAFGLSVGNEASDDATSTLADALDTLKRRRAA